MKQTSYEGGGPCSNPDEEDEVCNWRSDEDCDSREGGGVSLPPLSKDTPSAEEVRP